MGYYWAVTPEPSEEDAAELGLEVEFDDQGQAEAWLTTSYWSSPAPASTR